MTNRDAFRAIIRTIIIGILLWVAITHNTVGLGIVFVLIFIYFLIKAIDLKLFGEW